MTLLKRLNEVMNLFHIREDPFHWIQQIDHETDGIFQFKLFNKQLFYINDDDLIRYVFKLNRENYPKYFTGIGLVYGDRAKSHEAEHTIPSTHYSFQLMTRYKVKSPKQIQLIEKRTNEFLLSIENDQEIDVNYAMKRLTLLIIGDILFDYDFEPHVDYIVKHMDNTHEYMNRRFLGIFPFDLPTKQVIQHHRTRKFTENIMKGIYRDALDRYNNNQANLQRVQDIIIEHILDEPTAEKREELAVKELISVLTAGFGTLSFVLSTMLYHIASQTATYERIVSDEQVADRSSITSYLNDLQFVDKVFKETIRLYPPFWISSRYAVAKDMIAGVTIPKGAVILISPYFRQRSSKFWNNPDEFDPDRFGEDNNNISPYGFFPFGMGTYVCAGRYLANTEAMIICTKICKYFSLESTGVFHPKALLSFYYPEGLKLRFIRKENFSEDDVFSTNISYYE